MTIILEVTAVLGGAVKFSTYERKVTQAVWIAKAMMANIEYKWKYYDLKDIKAELLDQEVDPSLCNRQKYASDCDFKYNLTIKKWDLPLVDLLLGGLGGLSKSSSSKDDDAGADEKMGGSGNPMTDMIKKQVKDTIGDELLKTVQLEVFWPEGSKTDGVELAYLITGQQILDQQIELLQPPDGAADASNACPKGQVLKGGSCVPDTSAKDDKAVDPNAPVTPDIKGGKSTPDPAGAPLDPPDVGDMGDVDSGGADGE